MKIHWVVLVGALLSAAASAETTPCNEAVGGKKLTVADKKAFLKTCEANARTACSREAAAQNLTGAPKTTFEKKCLREAMGD